MIWPARPTRWEALVALDWAVLAEEIEYLQAAGGRRDPDQYVASGVQCCLSAARLHIRAPTSDVVACVVSVPRRPDPSSKLPTKRLASLLLDARA